MCDYCDFSSMNRASLVAFTKDQKSFAFVYVNNDHAIEINDRSMTIETDQKINYCPMCGRKL